MNPHHPKVARRTAANFAVFGAIWIVVTTGLIVAQPIGTLPAALLHILVGILLAAAGAWLIDSLPARLERGQPPAPDLAVQSASRQYELLVNNIDRYAIVLVDPQGIVKTWNRGAVALSDYTPEEAIGKHIAVMYADSENRQYIDKLLKRAQAEGTVEDESWRVRKHGVRYWASTTITPIYETDGQLAGYVRVSRDLTERKLAAETIERLNRAYSVLSAVNQAIVRIEDAEALFQEACRIAVEVGGFRMAWIGLLQEQIRTVKPVASAGIVEDYLQALNIMLDDSPSVIGPTTAALLSARPAIVADIAHDPCMESWRTKALSLGYRASAAFPLTVSDTVCGTLNLYSDEVDFFDETEVKLLAEMAGDISFALEHREQEEQRKRIEAERARLLAQLQTQAEQLNQIMRSVPEGVVLLDHQACVLLANPQATAQLDQLAGITADQTLVTLGGRPIESFMPTNSGGQWQQVQAANRTFEVFGRTLEAGASTDEGHSASVLVIRDISQDLLVQQQLQRQERLAAVGQLAAGIAHDFNNIMSIIAMYAQVLMQAPDLNERQHDRLSVIEQQAMRASQMIRQILDFSRRSVLDRQPLDLLPLLKEQVKLLERTLPEDIEIKLSHAPGEYHIKADPIRMQQVIMNLALNARDAMPDGGRLCFELAHIVVASAMEAPLAGMTPGRWVRLTVTDTGSGIAPAVLEHIFEPFYTTKEAGKGTGLGLAQVHGIVGQHEGLVTVASELGCGAAFTIYLPALVLAAPGSDSAQRGANLPRGQGQHILVVEDNHYLRATLLELLGAWGYNVCAASNGVEALEVLEQSTPIDLILSDVTMPQMGGIGLFNTLLRQGRLMPMLLMTANPTSDEYANLFERGLQGIINKPPGVEQLATTIAAVLSR